jgi:hypothetical protein
LATSRADACFARCGTGKIDIAQQHGMAARGTDLRNASAHLASADDPDDFCHADFPPNRVP